VEVFKHCDLKIHFSKGFQTLCLEMLCIDISDCCSYSFKFK